MGDRQSQACTFASRLSRKQRLKQSLLDGIGDAIRVIGNLNYSLMIRGRGSVSCALESMLQNHQRTRKGGMLLTMPNVADNKINGVINFMDNSCHYFPQARAFFLLHELHLCLLQGCSSIG